MALLSHRWIVRCSGCNDTIVLPRLRFITIWAALALLVMVSGAWAQGRRPATLAQQKMCANQAKKFFDDLVARSRQRQQLTRCGQATSITMTRKRTSATSPSLETIRLTATGRLRTAPSFSMPSRARAMLPTRSYPTTSGRALRSSRLCAMSNRAVTARSSANPRMNLMHSSKSILASS